MTEYHVVHLTPGQIPPDGSTGVALNDGAIMWIGDDGTFPTSATLGTHLVTDPVFDTTYTHSLATQNEIDEYNTTISG